MLPSELLSIVYKYLPRRTHHQLALTSRSVLYTIKNYYQERATAYAHKFPGVTVEEVAEYLFTKRAYDTYVEDDPDRSDDEEPKIYPMWDDRDRLIYDNFIPLYSSCPFQGECYCEVLYLMMDVDGYVFHPYEGRILPTPYIQVSGIMPLNDTSIYFLLDCNRYVSILLEDEDIIVTKYRFRLLCDDVGITFDNILMCFTPGSNDFVPLACDIDLSSVSNITVDKKMLILITNTHVYVTHFSYSACFVRQTISLSGIVQAHFEDHVIHLLDDQGQICFIHDYKPKYVAGPPIVELCRMRYLPRFCLIDDQGYQHELNEETRTLSFRGRKIDMYPLPILKDMCLHS